jgi:hypothetical protein
MPHFCVDQRIIFKSNPCVETSRISSIWNSSRIASSSSRCLGDESWMLGSIQQPLGELAGIPSPFPATQPNFFCSVRRRRRQLSKSPPATFELENKAFASDGTLPCLLSSSRCLDLTSADEKQRTARGLKLTPNPSKSSFC